MNELYQKLGYRFKDVSLLETALTHPSYGGDHHVPHYQRLEFLGDAVLELSVSRYLFHENPEVDEGKLTRIRAHLVREETLCRAATDIGLGRYIFLSVGEEHTGGRRKPSILSDVMEAVLAAVYLDGGFEAADALVMRVLGPYLKEEAQTDHLDAKSRLQEVLQREGRMPVYEFVEMQGPPHAPEFSYRVCVDGKVLGEGRGSSKQRAQQQAALNALLRMGEEA